MDDFSTGFSSLSYFKELPLEQLKIDQSFVRDLVSDQNDKAIVEAIITLGRAFDLNIIAEGVETQTPHIQLANDGCTSFLGYLFGRTISIHQANANLTQYAHSQLTAGAAEPGSAPGSSSEVS